jgi:high-affinity K+ transport system ATPase subunit B
MLQLRLSKSNRAEDSFRFQTDPPRRQVGPWFIPTRLSEPEFMKAIPLTFLSDLSPSAEFIFNDALAKFGKLFVPKGSQFIRPSGPYGISGIDLKESKLRKGHPFGIADWLKTTGGRIEYRTWGIIQQFLQKRGCLWAVVDEKSDVGVIWLSEEGVQLAKTRNRVAAVSGVGYPSKRHPGEDASC